MASEDTKALQRLAELIRQRRIDLDKPKVALAAAAGISPNTYLKVEEGRAVRENTYKALDAALGWASGSCRAVLDGAAEPIEIDRGPGDTVIARIPEEDLGQALTSAIVAVSDSLTAPEIRDMSRKVVEELKRRGLLEN
ncbi:helix-turn-helix domain-containing protein [Streptomyces bugieae]|uniref:Helix-turn-helix transcriptional regulator n=1 Tax=Streptomyces bugieae TaxID=3098223 RepID=A0ABU7NL06_9ACTN|nr:helix-turn-helix transcriptional regulator [Streptomyces sp. DSM 41528]